MFQFRGISQPAELLLGYSQDLLHIPGGWPADCGSTSPKLGIPKPCKLETGERDGLSSFVTLTANTWCYATSAVMTNLIVSLEVEPRLGRSAPTIERKRHIIAGVHLLRTHIYLR